MNPKTPSQPEDNIPDLEEPKEPIKKIKLPGFWGSLAIRARGMAVRLLVAGAVGLGVGEIAQDQFREKTGYNPDKTEAASPKKEPTPEEKKEAKGYIDRAEEFLRDIKNGAIEQGKELSGYKELERKYQELLKFCDKASFGLAFLMTFYASLLLLKALANMRQDALTRKQVDILGAKIDEQGTHINFLMSKYKAGKLTDSDMAPFVEQAKADHAKIRVIAGKLTEEADEALNDEPAIEAKKKHL